MTSYALFEMAGGRIYQAWRGRELDRTLAALPTQPAPRRVSYLPGSAIGRLEISRLGLSVVVLEGSDTGTLRLGVGRVTNSALPGEAGNVVLAGHRDTFFRSLREIRPGDRISLRTPQGAFAYAVDWTTVVDPADTSVLLPTAAPSLTLVTCYPFYYLGSAPQRFIVRAVPLGASAAASIPTAAAAPDPASRRRIQRPKPVGAPAVAVPGLSPGASPAAAALPAEAAPPAAPIVAAPDDPPAVPEAPPPPRQHGIRRAFHKLAAVFSPRRAKLQ